MISYSASLDSYLFWRHVLKTGLVNGKINIGYYLIVRYLCTHLISLVAGMLNLVTYESVSGKINMSYDLIARYHLNVLTISI